MSDAPMTPIVEITVEDLTRTILLLEAAQEALDAAAALELKREAGKRLRSITAQQRAKGTRAHVAALKAEYGLEIDYFDC